MRFRTPARVSSPHLGVVAVVTAATAFGYIRLLGQQGDWPGIDARQALVLSVLAGFAIMSAIGTIARSPSVRTAISAACAGGLFSLGFISLFSIGLPLIIAGAFALHAWRRVAGVAQRRDSLVLSLASASATIAVLAGGFAATG